MKKLTQYIAVLVIFAICLAVPGYAVENTNQRASQFFMSYSVYLWAPTNEAWFEVTAVGIMDEIGVSEIEIQRSTDQSNWTTVKTFEKEDYSQMVEEDTSAMVNCVPFTFTNGYYYRGVMTLYAKKGNGTATSTVVTATLNKR